MFGRILEAYGHTVVAAAALEELRGKPDHELLTELAPRELDALISLDHNRQPEVWSAVMGLLSNGTGRLVRVKLPRRERLRLNLFIQHWARGYDLFGPLLDSRDVKLIQIGLHISSQRSISGGFKAYRQREIARLVQQQFKIAPDGSLRRSRPTQRE